MAKRILFLLAAVIALLLPLLFDQEPIVRRELTAIVLATTLAFVLLVAFSIRPREKREVRYARAGRRLGFFVLLNVVVVVCCTVVAVAINGAYGPDWLGWLVLELFLLSALLITAVIVLRFIQGSSPERNGLEFVATAIVAFFAFVFLVLPALSRSRDGSRTPESYCSNNLKQLGLVFKMFSNDIGSGYYPELSPTPGCLSVANNRDWYVSPVFPEYMTDWRMLFCPLDERKVLADSPEGHEQELFDASTYVYFGYVISDDVELEAFAECYRARLLEGVGFKNDMMTRDGQIYRLREGVEKLLVENPDDPAACAIMQSLIPMLIERPGFHKKWINVLYLDGHVKAIKYPGEWPATERTFEIIHSLESLRANSR